MFLHTSRGQTAHTRKIVHKRINVSPQSLANAYTVYLQSSYSICKRKWIHIYDVRRHINVYLKSVGVYHTVTFELPVASHRLYVCLAMHVVQRQGDRPSTGSTHDSRRSKAAAQCGVTDLVGHTTTPDAAGIVGTNEAGTEMTSAPHQLLNTSALLTRYRCKLEECSQLHREVRSMHDKLHTSEQQLQCQKDACEALLTERTQLHNMLHRMAHELHAAHERLAARTGSVDDRTEKSEEGVLYLGETVACPAHPAHCASQPQQPCQPLWRVIVTRQLDTVATQKIMCLTQRRCGIRARREVKMHMTRSPPPHSMRRHASVKSCSPSVTIARVTSMGMTVVIVTSMKPAFCHREPHNARCRAQTRRKQKQQQQQQRRSV